MQADELDFKVLVERPVVRGDVASEVDIAVDVIASRGIDNNTPDHALNLCVVVDRSGSMSQSDKLEHAKKACVDIYRSLNAGDHFTMLAFDDEVISIVNPQTPSDDVLKRIRSLQPGGMTDLSKGWYLGLLELQTYGTDRHINRLILLSDGQANTGEVKASVLGAESGRARDELSITTSTVGIGADFEEDILMALARQSGGRFWYIGDSRIEEIVREEFSGALSVRFERPNVQLTLPAGVSVVREFNNIDKVAGRYRLQPIKANDRKCFAVRVRVDPAKLEGPALTLTATLLDGTDPVTTTETTLLVGTLDEYVRSPEDPAVTMAVSKYLAAATDEEIVAQLDAGEIETMVEMLASQSALIQEVERKLAGQHARSWGEVGQEMEARRIADERELGRVRMALDQNEALFSVAELVDLLRGLGAVDEADLLLRLVRKLHVHRHDRDMRWGESPLVDERGMERVGVVDILARAKDVAVVVGPQFSIAAGQFAEIIGRIDEQLARIS